MLQANLFPFTAGFKTVGNPELTNASGAFSFPVVGLSENAQLRIADGSHVSAYSVPVLIR